MSRKFVSQQKSMASATLAEVFSSSAQDDEVLFERPVTKTWLRRLTLGVTLIGHGSYRGVIELMRDLLGVSISKATFHNVHQAAQQAGATNRRVDLPSIRISLHEEIFQGSQPVFAGVDARSTYCYLLAAAEHRDDTWGVHLLDASQQGLNPDYTIRSPMRAGTARRTEGGMGRQALPWRFHIEHQCEVWNGRLASA